MRKEYASLRRRPFLAPVWLAALAGALIIALGIWLLGAASTTTVFVMRHAEKAEAPAEDPPLSPAGEARALELAQHFGRGPKAFGFDRGFLMRRKHRSNCEEVRRKVHRREVRPEASPEESQT